MLAKNPAMSDTSFKSYTCDCIKLASGVINSAIKGE